MASKTDSVIVIKRMRTETTQVGLIGVSPYISHRNSETSMKELTYPRKGDAAKRDLLKHDPHVEFLESLYLLDDAPTLCGVPATAIKGAMMTAALDEEAVYKTTIGRLVWVENSLIPLYGIPVLGYDIVRQSGRTGAPDSRFRAFFMEWAVKVEITFQVPRLNVQQVMNLLESGGARSGLGDWRPEKAGDYGRFRVVDMHDPDFVRICESGQREAQAVALEKISYRDSESRSFVEWFYAEVERRGDSAMLWRPR